MDFAQLIGKIWRPRSELPAAPPASRPETTWASRQCCDCSRNALERMALETQVLEITAREIEATEATAREVTAHEVKAREFKARQPVDEQAGDSFLGYIDQGSPASTSTNASPP